MKRLLPLLALTACGLDDFSWGGPKDPCGVEWQMSFDEPEELERIRPRVSQVEELPDGIVWTASYAFDGEGIKSTFRIIGGRFEVIESNTDEMETVRSNQCEYDESESRYRDEPLARHSCRVDFIDQVEGSGSIALYTVRFVIEEIDHCPPG